MGNRTAIIFFDIETSSTDEEICNDMNYTLPDGLKWTGKKVIPYAIGWWELDMLDYLNRRSNFDPLVIKRTKRVKEYYVFNKDCIKIFIRWLINSDIIKKCKRVICYAHNLPYDMPFFHIPLMEMMGKEIKGYTTEACDKEIDNIKKRIKSSRKFIVNSEWEITPSHNPKLKFKLIFKDTYFFQQMSYGKLIEEFKDENGNELKKLKGLTHIDKYDMKFDDEGNPVSYRTIDRKATFETCKLDDEGDPLFEPVYKVIQWKDVEDNEKAYLKRDVECGHLIIINQERIRRESIKLTMKECGHYDFRSLSNTMINHLPTIGSLAKYCANYTIKHFFKDDPDIKQLLKDSELNYYKDNVFDKIFKYPLETKEEYDIENGSIFGGFTSGRYINRWSAKDGKVGLLLDFNSLYPYIMTLPLPYGKPLKTKPKGKEGVDYYEDWYIIPRHKLKGKYKYPVEPKWKPGINFQSDPIGKSKWKELRSPIIAADNGIWIYRFYFDGVIKKYTDFKYTLVERRYWKAKPLLRKFIDIFQTIKQKNSAKETPSEELWYLIAKLISNSIYGKSTEKPPEDTEYYSNIHDAIVDEETYREENDTISQQPFYHLQAGRFVTSMARKMIISTIVDEFISKGSNVFYCDTDSIISEWPSDDSNIKVDGKKLGFLKLEKVFTEFFYNGKLKKYLCITPKEFKSAEEAKDYIFKHSSAKHRHYFDDADFSKITSRKGAMAGLPASKLVKDLTLDQIKLLFNPRNNVLFFAVRNFVSKDNRFRTINISKSHSEFNSKVNSEWMNGKFDIFGVEKITHIGLIDEETSDIIIKPVYEII